MGKDKNVTTGAEIDTSPLEAYLGQVQWAVGQIPLEPVIQLIEWLERARAERRNVFIFGNGGSAALASHMANDLAKGTIGSGKPRFRVISLSDNIPLLTAWANDTEYQKVFAEQLANLVEPGDLVLAISTSGNSPNVLRAVELARESGALTVGLTGSSGGVLKGLVHLLIPMPVDDTGQVEALQSILCHLIAKSLC
jgi:D-sedoheptulose 7-phosphate isomerase